MRTLILFATKYGSVEKAAGLLKTKLKSEVDIVNLKIGPVPSLDNFDAIILGGSIYVGKIQHELYEFCKNNIEQLLSKKLGLFVCAGQTELALQEKQLAHAFPAELVAHACVKETVGDEIILERMSLMDRWAVRLIKGIKLSYSNISDANLERIAEKMNE